VIVDDVPLEILAVGSHGQFFLEGTPLQSGDDAILRKVLIEEGGFFGQNGGIFVVLGVVPGAQLVAQDKKLVLCERLQHYFSRSFHKPLEITAFFDASFLVFGKNASLRFLLLFLLELLDVERCWPRYPRPRRSSFRRSYKSRIV
jgi:hypothetical protein